MKKTKMLFAVLFLAILATIIAGCGDDSTTTPGALAVTTASLPAATTGTAYNQTLVASGGTAPYSWSISVGALPAGLNLNTSTGAITGTPTTAGPATTFTVKITDSATPGGTATKILSIAVNAPAALTVTTPSLPAATIGTLYSQTIAASGGTGPYTWTLATGSAALPAWLTLSSAGTLSGTPPTGAVTASFTVMVTDSATPAGTATKAFSITVSSAPAAPAAPTITAATGGTNSVTISWSAVAGATSYNLYWSPATGVTTATGTKITLANVTSTKHSRLTATPTWLAANTPYFYIVTAVNATGESTPSAQTTATTSATDGVTLYGTSCGGCHNPLATTAKPGRTALQIQNAINSNTGGMGFLSTLLPPQVQAIADVLVTGF